MGATSISLHRSPIRLLSIYSVILLLLVISKGSLLVSFTIYLNSAEISLLGSGSKVIGPEDFSWSF